MRDQSSSKKSATKSPSEETIEAVFGRLLDAQIAALLRVFKGKEEARFIGDGTSPKIETRTRKILREVVKDTVMTFTEKQRRDLLKVAELALVKDVRSSSMTGIVIAGFGAGELFPTLVSFEIEGLVFNRLKYRETNYVDIDRGGAQAKVLPFAQKEMVDRFLYGLDDQIERLITAFCSENIAVFRQAILDRINFAEESEEASLNEAAKEAEQAFLDGLKDQAFERIRSGSRAAIEDMVEFMPKPELAKMAEALVNLTSIKRKVSPGFETVGGPIDVAVISQSEGFVWIKRKHYFPPELNSRYFARLRNKIDQ